MKLKVLIRTKVPNGETASQVYDLNESYCIIGRKSKTLPLTDNACSGEHAVLFQDFDGHLHIRDLGSTNGTFVNGNRIVDAALHVGSEIAIGKTKLKVLEFAAVGIVTEKAAVPQLEEMPTPSGFGGARGQKVKEATVVGVPVVKGWPDQFRALPSEKQNEFVEYVDREGTKSRISIHELIEEDVKKQAA